MALVKCSSCGNDISDKAKKCPSCNKRIKKEKHIHNGKIVVIFSIAVLVIVGISIAFIVKNEMKKRHDYAVNALLDDIEDNMEEHEWESVRKDIDELAELDYDTDELEDGLVKGRQDELLTDYREACRLFDFDEIESIIDALKDLGYDVNGMEELLEYDRKYYSVASIYHAAVERLNNQCINHSYSTLRGAVNELVVPTDNIFEAEVNNKSEIGRYIYSVQSDVWVNIFNSQFLYSNEYDLDYSITRSSYAVIIRDYTDGILKIRLPWED